MASRADRRLARIGETLEEYKDRKKTQSRLTDERRVVRALVKRVGAPLIAGLSRDDEDEMYMTFSWFYDQFPGFPVRLAAEGVWKPGLADFLRMTTRKNDIWPKWADLSDALSESSMQYGMAFPFPDTVVGLSYGVLHNGVLPEPEGDYAYMARKIGEDKVILESMDSFASRVLQVWDPV